LKVLYSRDRKFIGPRRLVRVNWPTIVARKKENDNNMTAMEVGKKLVELCQQGKNHEAMETLYSPDIVSVEAMSPPGGSPEMKGIDAVMGKGKWWVENHEVHSAVCEGPFPNGDRFIVRFNYDVTNKPSGKRMKMDEAALYTVAGGKIVKEEFFYSMG
jgi:ketosteroid isomerase-like protein